MVRPTRKAVRLPCPTAPSGRRTRSADLIRPARIFWWGAGRWYRNDETFCDTLALRDTRGAEVLSNLSAGEGKEVF